MYFGAGYGNRTRLHGLGSRCITDIRTLRWEYPYYSKENVKNQSFFGTRNQKENHMMDQGVEQVKNLFGRVKTLPYGGGLWGDCKGYQVCVILNVVKNLRMEWVLSMDDSGKILRLRYATLRMTRFFGSPSVLAGVDQIVGTPLPGCPLVATKATFRYFAGGSRPSPTGVVFWKNAENYAFII